MPQRESQTATKMESSVMKNQGKEVPKMVKDPVCRMTVDEKRAPAKSDYMGKTYYFCSLACKKAFDDNPAKYVGGSRVTAYNGHHM